MHINSKDKICNIPILKIRDFLRRNDDSQEWPKFLLKNRLKISEKKASELIKALVDLGYIEYTRTYDREKYWRRTLKGSTFSLASAAKPILRSTAEKHLSGLLKRVRHINESTDFLYKVTKVIVFGSFLSDSQKLNDVDVAVELVWKGDHPNIKGQDKTQISLDHAQKAIEKGREFSNFTAMLIWPHTEVMLYLKSRSRVISLHTTEDKILNKAKIKVLYEELCK